MRIISNQELLCVAGGSESEDDPEATLIQGDEGNLTETVGGGGADPEKDGDKKSVVQQVAETIKEIKQVVPTVKGKASVDVIIKLDESKPNSAEIRIHLEVDGTTGSSKTPPATKK